MKKAFTLVELLIVLIIIGILAALVIPRFHGLIVKARGAEAKRILAALADAQYQYYTETGKFCGGGAQYYDFSGLNIPRPASKYWYYYTTQNWDTRFGGPGQGANSYGVVWAQVNFEVLNGETMEYIIAFVGGDAPSGSDGATPPGPVVKKYYHWTQGQPNWEEGWPS